MSILFDFFKDILLNRIKKYIFNKEKTMQLKNVKIRKIAKQDKKAVSNLLQILTTSTQKGLINNKLIKMFCGKNTFAKIISVEIDGKEKILGFGIINFFPTASAGGLVGKIDDIVVIPRYRNYGLATKLCKHLIDIAKAKKAKHIELTSNPKRTAAHKLYKKLGFKKKKTNVFILKL